MANLKNFTLDGKAIRVVARADQHGKKYFTPAILHEYDREMTEEQFKEFAAALLLDVYPYGSLLHLYNGKLTNQLLKMFIGEGEDDQQEDGT